MPPELILDPTELDMSRLVAGREEMRQTNPQRFEMEQVDGIVLIDSENHVIVGYKDVRDDEFWVRPHARFPADAWRADVRGGCQMVSYYIAVIGMKSGDFIAFGGMENVRFRGVVGPGERLVLVAACHRSSLRIPRLPRAPVPPRTVPQRLLLRPAPSDDHVHRCPASCSSHSALEQEVEPFDGVQSAARDELHRPDCLRDRLLPQRLDRRHSREVRNHGHSRAADSVLCQVCPLVLGRRR